MPKFVNESNIFLDMMQSHLMNTSLFFWFVILLLKVICVKIKRFMKKLKHLFSWLTMIYVGEVDGVICTKAQW